MGKCECNKCGEMENDDFVLVCGRCSILVCEECSNGIGPDKHFFCGDAAYALNSYITDADICSDCLPKIIREAQVDGSLRKLKEEWIAQGKSQDDWYWLICKYEKIYHGGLPLTTCRACHPRDEFGQMLGDVE